MITALAITAETIAKPLGGCKASSGWIARCPAHDDRKTSFSIGETKDRKILVRNTLIGFADIHIEPWQLTINDVVLHSKNGRRRAQFSSKPLLDKAIKPLISDYGRVRYVKILSFDSRDIADRFSAAVISAVDEYVGGAR